MNVPPAFLAAAERRLAAAGAGRNVTIRLVVAEVVRGREVAVVEYELHFSGGKVVANEGHERFPLDARTG